MERVVRSGCGEDIFHQSQRWKGQVDVCVWGGGVGGYSGKVLHGKRVGVTGPHFAVVLVLVAVLKVPWGGFGKVK